jgi:hypothetical protein
LDQRSHPRIGDHEVVHNCSAAYTPMTVDWNRPLTRVLILKTGRHAHFVTSFPTTREFGQRYHAVGR